MITLKNLAVPFFLLVYLVNFLLIDQIEGFPVEEALSVFVILGCIFSPVAFFLTRNSQPLASRIKPMGKEIWVVGGVFIYISIVLLFGSASIVSMLPDSIRDSSMTREITSMLFKLIVFVIVPFQFYKHVYGFEWKNFGLVRDTSLLFTKKNIIILATMASLFFLLQWFGGRAAAPIRNGEFSVSQLAIGLPLAFLWLVIEVGLVEEFFFRALLQDRLSGLFKSEWWGIVTGCLLFGIAHAPGMYFRGAGQVEGLGSDASFLTCVGYCVAVQSAAGIPFAIVWSKTRNLWLVMAIHASVDLFSNFPSLVQACCTGTE